MSYKNYYTGCGTHENCPNCLSCKDRKPIPNDVASKVFDVEKAKKFLHDEPKLWDDYEIVKQREEFKRNA